jgi:hypothetical protein
LFGGGGSEIMFLYFRDLSVHMSSQDEKMSVALRPSFISPLAKGARGISHILSTFKVSKEHGVFFSFKKSPPTPLFQRGENSGKHMVPPLEKGARGIW